MEREKLIETEVENHYYVNTCRVRARIKGGKKRENNF